MRTDIRYTPSDVFDTFPQPATTAARVGETARQLNEFRADTMIRSDLGLTKTYNRVHDTDEHDLEILRLRELHVELDLAVRDAYGWTDIALDHRHWATPQGIRFTVSPSAKDELLNRLVELNHQRFAEEVAAGLHDARAMKAKANRSKPVDENQELLL